MPRPNLRRSQALVKEFCQQRGLSYCEASFGGSYAQALRYAEAACRLEPGNGNHLNTLGVAQYRAGRYQEALATLTRSDQIKSKVPNGSPAPSDLAFLAMAQHRLGKKAEARATLARLIQAMKDPAVAEKRGRLLATRAAHVAR